MRIVALLLVPLATLHHSCLLTSAEPIRGKKSRFPGQYEYPFAVSLGNKDKEDPVKAHVCGGILISRLHVLTVAHCLKDETPSKMFAAIGNIDLHRAKQYDIVEWVLYDEWATLQCAVPRYKINDIAVVFLKERVYHLKIKPVVLTQLVDLQLYRTKATMMGWGVTDDGVKTRYLKSVDVKFLTKEDSEKKLYVASGRRISLNANRLMSMEDPYALSGCGDSGGPIVDENNELVAIIQGYCPKVLWGDKDEAFSKKYQLNLHVSINFYRDFIIAMKSMDFND